MIRAKDFRRSLELEKALVSFATNELNLPGIADIAARRVLIAQIIESERRQNYVDHIRTCGVDGTNVDPHSLGFNPLYASVYHAENGDLDEACWILFLATHFGKNKRTKWGLCKSFYGRLNSLPIWSWNEAISNQAALANWIADNATLLKENSFGNHRKYESIESAAGRGLAEVIQSYFSVFPNGHRTAFDDAINGANDPSVRFDSLYNLFSEVFRFGRLACFDHVAMICRLGLENAVPGSTYLRNATGPKRGAALLIHDNAGQVIDVLSVEKTLQDLGRSLNVDAQVLEDSLCNWQKSPREFIAFR